MTLADVAGVRAQPELQAICQLLRDSGACALLGRPQRALITHSS